MKKSLYGKVFDWLGLEPVSAASHTAPAALALVWKPWIFGSDYTSVSQDLEALRQHSPELRVVNDTHFDDDKAHIEREFARHFGYVLAVDPRTHCGLAVRKSRKNAAHDGEVVQCPVASPSDTHVFERVVNNVTEEGFAEDLRVSVVSYEPRLCYLKYRSLDDRFSNTNDYARLATAYDVFSSSEVVSIESFCRGIGLEVGEIDVLRDRDDGRIYIVDANNTPYGPPNHMGGRERALVVCLLADAFVRAYNV